MTKSKYARLVLVAAAAVSLSACNTTGTARSLEQRAADRETIKTILEHCEVTITANTTAAANASVLPSASADLAVSLGGTCNRGTLPKSSPEGA